LKEEKLIKDEEKEKENLEESKKKIE